MRFVAGKQTIRQNSGHETEVEPATCVSQQKDRHIRETKTGHETDVSNTTLVSRLQILYQNQSTKKIKHTLKKFNSHIFRFL